MSVQVVNLLRTLSITIPPLYFVKDSFFTIHKIEGNRMNPVLLDGDIVLIRKADFFPGWNFKNISVNDMNDESHKLDEENDRCLALRMDELGGVPRPTQTTLWRCPPSILPGDIVSYYSPTMFRKVEVQRIVALGGQRVRIKGSYHKIISLRPYSFYTEVEGESKNEYEHTFDKIHFDNGISKKLLIGTVERIIWPPHRWSAVERKRPAVGRSWWP